MMSDRETVLRLRTEPAYREGFKAGLKRAYDCHKESVSNPIPFLEWVLEFHGPEIWNELYQVKHSSHVVSLTGLTRADGRRITKGF